MALLLAVSYTSRRIRRTHIIYPAIDIPARTYISVPMSIMHAGCYPTFRTEQWTGLYQLRPLPVWDCARRFTGGMYRPGEFQCVSFHWSKILGIQQGGAILHDDARADTWLRRARFDGRSEGGAPADDTFQQVGWHCYMSPETAAQGLMRLSLLPEHNDDLPNDDYPDLSLMRIFTGAPRQLRDLWTQRRRKKRRR